MVTAQPKSKAKSDSANAAEESAERPLVVVEVRKRQSRKRIRRLRRGRGRLMDRVKDTLAELKEKGEVDADAQPVVFVIRRKSKNWRFKL